MFLAANILEIMRRFLSDNLLLPGLEIRNMFITTQVLRQNEQVRKRDDSYALYQSRLIRILFRNIHFFEPLLLSKKNYGKYSGNASHRTIKREFSDEHFAL